MDEMGGRVTQRSAADAGALVATFSASIRMEQRLFKERKEAFVLLERAALLVQVQGIRGEGCMLLMLMLLLGHAYGPLAPADWRGGRSLAPQQGPGFLVGQCGMTAFIAGAPLLIPLAFLELSVIRPCTCLLPVPPTVPAPAPPEPLRLHPPLTCG
jgi:hypothetical protein